MTRFAIACVGRVGSSFLESLIDSHPDASCFGEIVSHPPVSLGSAAEVATFLDRTLQAALTPVSGFKLPFFSLPLPEGIMTTLSERGFRFVHIQRKNKFDQYLSMRLAQVNNAWRSDTGSYGVDRIHIEPEEALRHIAGFSSLEIQIPEQIGSAFPYHPVSYEDVVSGDALPGLLDFLGLTRRPLTSVYQRQRRTSQRDAIVNYDEVATALIANGLGHLLEGEAREPTP